MLFGTSRQRPKRDNQRSGSDQSNGNTTDLWHSFRLGNSPTDFGDAAVWMPAPKTPWTGDALRRLNLDRVFYRFSYRLS